ncbi:MAG: endolytic transglycosylase MltG [Pseudomonadota bacterium]
MEALEPYLAMAREQPTLAGAVGFAAVAAVVVAIWALWEPIGRWFRVRHLAANALTLVLAGLVAIVATVEWGRWQIEAPGPLAEETIVEVPRGATMREATERLVAAGAVGNETLFTLAAKYRGDDARLKFGEYVIEPGASMVAILDKLTRGETLSYRVTVAEGLTSWEIVELLKGVDVLTGEVAEVPPEGSLAPDTYFVARNDTREDVIRRMQAAQERILAEAWAARDAGLPLDSPEEALILASVVEKETGLAGERPQVASVFINRLRRGMPLQSDPTVIYGITEGQGGLGRGLRRSELRARTRWNTYTIPALPATPIANPGRASIEAVLRPAETDFLYFVADGTGGHAFSRTLDEHNANVRVWRAIERERREAEEASSTE